MNSWLGLSRYSLVFFKYIFGLYDNINLRFFNIITYINVFIYSIMYLYFIKIDTKKDNITKDVLSILIVISSPVLLEQYNFTLQSPEVSFGMILMMISYITTYKYLKDNKIIYSIITIVLLTLTFGIYQAFVNLYLLGVFISIYKIKNNRKANIIKSIIFLLLV